MKLKHLVLSCLVFSWSLMAQAQGLPQQGTLSTNFFRVATLEWAPFTSKLMPREGISTAIVNEAAKQINGRVLTNYFTWAQAVELGEKDPAFDGYFPAKSTKTRAATCYLSGPIGTSVVGIATLNTKPIKWEELKDLEHLKLGIIDGYVNSEDFDDGVKAKRQPVEVFKTDAENLNALLAGKIDGMVVNRHVLSYTLTRLPSAASQVIFTPKPLSSLPLHVCFKRTPEGMKKRDLFDKGLAKTNVSKLEEEYFKTLVVK